MSTVSKEETTINKKTRSASSSGFSGNALLLRIAGFSVLILLSILACIALGSVPISLQKTARVLLDAVKGIVASGDMEATIILTIRLPRVLSVFLVGASLSICGAAMQGLLRNPLADGATLGVSAGASLGAMLAILFGISLPLMPLAGTALVAVLFAFLSLMLVLSLAFALDRSLATSTIILIGVIYTMFMGSLMSLLISFSGSRLRSITFWTLGSLSGTGYGEVVFLSGALLICGSVLLLSARELDAFAMGEDKAHNIGVSVRRVKLRVMIFVSILIGVSVSIGGTIGFVGLVIPHISRLIIGPSHRRLLPVSIALGGVFLLFCDLLARTILSPIELPLGVVTSLIGAVFFLVILIRSRRRTA